MANDKQQATAQAQASAYPNVINVNEQKTLFSNPRADIPIFHGDQTKDSKIYDGSNQNCTNNILFFRCSNSW
jgi:hypothetical protein